ncbi:MAG: hypothetical protein Q8938_11720 [Bacteroidota bacterium]|nr:hypothetical protein [Bacteroidota bacterium]
MENYALMKKVWTNADFDELDWMGCQIHGMTIVKNRGWCVGDLVFDVDYIVETRWEDGPGQKKWSWIAPATITFKEVNIAWMNSIMCDTISFGWDVLAIDRLGVSFTSDGVDYYKWQIEMENGTILIDALSLEMVIRRKPIKTSKGYLPAAVRG